MKEKIKACPHCGCKAEAHQAYDGFWQVQCGVCGCGTLQDRDKEHVIKAWNKRIVDGNKTITCFKCHGVGKYKVPIDPDYSWDECEQVKCEICGGTGKITLEAYERFQERMRGDEI